MARLTFILGRSVGFVKLQIGPNSPPAVRFAVVRRGQDLLPLEYAGSF